MNVTKEKKKVAKVAVEAFGGTPKILRYGDAKEESVIDMVSCPDRPYKGVASYSTIGLLDYSVGFTSNEEPICIEIAGACSKEHDCFGNILASCAFNIINTNFACYPGAIFPNVVKEYLPDNSMKHVLFVPPFLWNDQLETLNFNDKKVTWLMAIPISDQEFEYAQENGSDALEMLFEEYQIDIFDLRRKSVL